MARPPAKRRSETDADGSESEEGSSNEAIKRMKLEHANNHDGEDETNSISDANDDVVEGDRDELEADGEESDIEDEAAATQRLEYPDDEANVEIFQRVRAKERKLRGSAPTAGVIKQVHLINFMCHANLKVDMGPKMNFLVGHNGSGKSAILTAIAVAFGGKANATGRADRGIKGLIKSGQDKAVIILTLANSGPEAFKPEIYDPNIVIERTIDKSGSSSYRFRATIGGKILASKREELNHMCQWFSIAIDSPLTILTQDAARSFLQNANDHDLYKVFLGGTQLTALAQQYQTVNEQLDSLQVLLQRQQEQVPDLILEEKELAKQCRALDYITDLRKQRQDVLNELAWAYVEDKEKEREEIAEKLQTLGSKLEGIQKNIDSEVSRLEPLEAEVKRLEQELDDYSKSRQPIERDKAARKKGLQDAKNALRKRKDDDETTRRDISSAEKDIREYNERIAALVRARDVEEDPKQRALKDKIKDRQTRIRKFRAELPVIEKRVENLTHERDARQEAVEKMESEILLLRDQASKALSRLRDLSGQANNRVDAFGEKMDLVIRDIRSKRWRDPQGPLGPLGMHVKLEDWHYRDAIQSFMGAALCGFAVTNQEDLHNLQRLLTHWSNHGYRPKTGSKIPTIVRHSGDIFDYAAGDRSSHGETVLSKLTVDNEAVLRILINQSHIESVFVSPTITQANKEMTQMLDTYRKPCTYITADLFRTDGRSSNSRTSGPLGRWNATPLFVRDYATEITALKAEVSELELRLEHLNRDCQAEKNKLKAKQDERAAAIRDLDKCRTAPTALQRESDGLEQQLAMPPEDEVTGIEATITTRQQELESLERKLQDSERPGESIVKDIEQKQAELDALDEQLNNFVPEKNRRQTDLQAVIASRTKVVSDLKHWRSSLKTTDDARLAKENEAAQVEEDYTTWTQQAVQFCAERISVTKTVKQLVKRRTEVEATIKEAERRHTRPSEVVLPLWNAAKAKLETTKKNIKSLGELHKIHTATVQHRKAWWREARGHIAVRARCLFILHLLKRNFDGRLKFEHERETLSIKVSGVSGQTQDTQDGATQSNFRVPRNLSGGERSFATVSLLLSLWDTIPSPVRCLDEWDVFLDAMNRKIAAGMLVEGAKESEGKQFILITPQNMAGIDTGDPENKLIRMSDPVRDQTTLDFRPV